MTHDVWETSSLASMRTKPLRRTVEELRALEPQLVEAELNLTTLDFYREQYQDLFTCVGPLPLNCGQRLTDRPSWFVFQAADVVKERGV